jgi:hypothetical protein
LSIIDNKFSISYNLLINGVAVNNIHLSHFLHASKTAYPRLLLVMLIVLLPCKSTCSLNEISVLKIWASSTIINVLGFLMLGLRENCSNDLNEYLLSSTFKPYCFNPFTKFNINAGGDIIITFPSGYKDK